MQGHPRQAGNLMPRVDSSEKTLMLGKTEGGRRRDEMVGWHHRLDGHEFEQAPGDSAGQTWQSTRSQRVRHDLVTTQQQRDTYVRCAAVSSVKPTVPRASHSKLRLF